MLDRIIPQPGALRALVLALFILLGLLAGLIAGRLVRAALATVARRTSTAWDDDVLARLGPSLSATCACISVGLVVPLLDIAAPTADRMEQLVRVVGVASIFWGLWRLVDVGRHALSASRWATAIPASRSLMSLGARVAKIVVAALGLAAVLSLLGYPVTSLLAGLGIGGLAVALAAQKTVENLFGAFSIGVDQPFREGDFVKVDDIVGTVEAIGLRSTRFRTLDRTIVTLPNGRLADMRLESFSARDRLRFACIVGLVYDTSAAQMRSVLTGFERVLRAHPAIWPDAVVVRFSELAASSLNVEVMAWFRTSDWSEFQGIRQDVLLRFMDVVEAAGTSFAFPTTTVHLAGTTTAAAMVNE